MFHEEFILEQKDDDPAGEYDSEKTVIKYYMHNIYTENSLLETIEHEWIHALSEWADESEWDGDKDHYIMRALGFN